MNPRRKCKTVWVMCSINGKQDGGVVRTKVMTVIGDIFDVIKKLCKYHTHLHKIYQKTKQVKLQFKWKRRVHRCKIQICNNLSKRNMGMTYYLKWLELEGLAQIYQKMLTIVSSLTENVLKTRQRREGKEMDDWVKTVREERGKIGPYHQLFHNRGVPDLMRYVDSIREFHQWLGRDDFVIVP